jgi:LmbE family N-acetylglucosaminyl deacetylase
MDRRKMLTVSGGLLGAPLFAWPAMANGGSADGKDKIKVIVVGGHPDDPESGCGGTICKLTQAGHEVVSLYLTRGEAGIAGTSHEAAAKIRSSEISAACKVTNSRPRFFGQVDGDTMVNKEAYARMDQILEEENPHIVLTHWPIDTHPDHRVASNLVYNTWNRFRWDDTKAFDLYYYEVLTGAQTQNFHPGYYIDITETHELKKEATMKHVSQKPEEWFDTHEKMSLFRGFESGSKYAEAFVRQGVSKVL